MHYRVFIPENTDIQTAFSKIPAKTTKLNLRCLELGMRNKDDVIKACALIPKTVTDLDIRYNEFEKLSDEQFAQVLSSIGNHVESLCIQYKDFLKLVNLVVKASVNPFRGFLTTLKTLKLYGNGTEFQFLNANNESIKQLIECFQSVPQTVVNLELNMMGLFRTYQEASLLVHCFSYLPKNITSLGLSKNWISQLPSVTLRVLFATIPQIKTLDISENNFSVVPGLPEGELLEFFLILPINIHTLIIGQQYMSDNPTLDGFFTNLPAHITVLDIGKYFLASLTTFQLKKIFLTIPTTVEFLSLRCSGFAEPLTFCMALSVIPKGVSTVDLSENHFEKLPTWQFILILSNLPSHIRNVILSFNDFKKRGKEELMSLAAAMPHVIGLEFFDDDTVLDPSDVGNDGNAYDSVQVNSVLETLRKHMGRLGKEQFITSIYALNFLQPSIPADLIRIIFDYNYYYPPIYKFKPMIPVASTWWWPFSLFASSRKPSPTFTIESDECSSVVPVSKK